MIITVVHFDNTVTALYKDDFYVTHRDNRTEESLDDYIEGFEAGAGFACSGLIATQHLHFSSKKARVPWKRIVTDEAMPPKNLSVLIKWFDKNEKKQ